MPRLLSALLLSLLLPVALWAQDSTEPAPETEAETEQTPETDPTPKIAEAPMTLERLDKIIRALDPNMQTDGRVWQMSVAEVMLIVVTDETADRMRIMAPLKAADAVTEEEMIRMMQANFDTALDARYAIAQGTLWATYIHPISRWKRISSSPALVRWSIWCAAMARFIPVVPCNMAAETAAPCNAP